MASFTALNPFSRTTFGQTFDRTVDVLFERLDLFGAVAVMMYLPFTLLQISTSSWLLPEPVGYDAVLWQELFPRGDRWQEHVSLMALEWSFNGLVGIVGQAALTLTVARMYLEQTESLRLGAVLREGLSHCVHLLCASALAALALGLTLGVAVGLMGPVLVSSSTTTTESTSVVWLGMGVVVAMMASVMGIYLAISFLLVTPVIVVEHLGPMEGLARAWELAWDNRCYIFCTNFVVSLSAGMASLIVSEVLLFDGPFWTMLKNLPFLFSFPVSSVYVRYSMHACMHICF